MAKDPQEFAEILEGIRKGELTKAHVSHLELTDDDAFALAEIIESTDTLNVIIFGDRHRMTADGKAAISQAARNNKNLVHLILAGGEMERNADRNWTAAHDLVPKLGNFKEASPKEWLEMSVRLSAINHVGGISISRKETEAFKSFMDELPQADPTQPPHALYDANEAGYTPLDNPKTWQHFDTIMKTFNANGFQLRADSLLEDGKPTTLFQKIIYFKQAAALFTENNLNGVGKVELRALLTALPDNVKEQIPNRHSLLASAERSNAATRTR